MNINILSAVLIGAFATVSCGSSQTATTGADPVVDDTQNQTPAEPAGWTAAQSVELLATCNKAWIAADGAGIRACYDDAYVQEAANDVFGIPADKGSDAHVRSAKNYKIFFEGIDEVQLTLATPTRVAEIWFQENTTTDAFPIPAGRGKKLVSLTAKISRLDENGKLISELYVGNQASFGNQTGLWKSPFPVAEVKRWAAPQTATSTGSATEMANLEITRKADAAFHARDIETQVSFYAEPNKAWEPMGSSENSTRAEQRKQIEGFLTSTMKESTETVLDEFAAGDWVVRLIRQKVVLHDKLKQFPKASGKTTELINLQFSRLKDGLIVESYGFYNPLSLQAQIGLFDPASAQKVIAEAMEAMEKTKKAEGKGTE